jgi:TolB-like protein
VVPPVIEPSHAVFLSYASQDAEAAQRICEALRAAGIEVWFDQSALRGGDVWDHTIRKQIKTCALFIPVISRHTHQRDEGYFRLEWKLAVDRSHLMTTNKAFLLPVVVDDTREDDENVPDRFRDIHWTRLPGGETLPAFVERVQRLVSPEASQTTVRPTGPVSSATPPMRERVPASWRLKGGVPAIAAVVILGALAYLAVDKLWILKHPAPPAAPPTFPPGVAPVAFAPPPHSIAVLPFVNMSGDPKQEYFSDGLTEELLNSLARINELQVAGRTSSFYFKGKDVDLGTVAHKLNVAAVLEGSVRRSAHTVRITAQLINAVTGFHLWSQTYDRDLGDVLKVQTEIANSVASALKVTLLGDTAAKIALGGTHNPDAFDAYLRAEKAYRAVRSFKNDQDAIAAYTEAIHLDPGYALAFAGRSLALDEVAGEFTNKPEDVGPTFKKAEADAQRAIELAPELAEGHLALAGALFFGSLDFTRGIEQYERAVALAPSSTQILRIYGRTAVLMGRTEAGIAANRRAVALDPLSPRSHDELGQALFFARRHEEGLAALKDAITLEPGYARAYGNAGLHYYALGNLQSARASCETRPDSYRSQWCLALTYDKLNRHTDAEAAVTKLRALGGDTLAYQYATIYAQWGDTARALQWLETAMRLRDPGLAFLKTDPLMDPLRKEPRFQAIERELKFPS